MLGLNRDRILAEQASETQFMRFQPYAFFDDSGKWHDRNFVCLCGYLSDETNWNQFIGRWLPLLRKHDLRSIRMSSFYTTAKGRNWSAAKTNEVLTEFATIIRDHVKVGIAVGMDAKHYRGLPKAVKDGIATPDIACPQRMLRLIRDKLTAEKYQGRVCVTLAVRG